MSSKCIWPFISRHAAWQMTKALSATAIVLIFFIDKVLIPAPMVTSSTPGDVSAGEGDAYIFAHCVRSWMWSVDKESVGWQSGGTWPCLIYGVG